MGRLAFGKKNKTEEFARKSAETISAGAFWPDAISSAGRLPKIRRTLNSKKDKSLSTGLENPEGNLEDFLYPLRAPYDFRATKQIGEGPRIRRAYCQTARVQAVSNRSLFFGFSDCFSQRNAKVLFKFEPSARAKFCFRFRCFLIKLFLFPPAFLGQAG